MAFYTHNYEINWLLWWIRVNEKLQAKADRIYITFTHNVNVTTATTTIRKQNATNTCYYHRSILMKKMVTNNSNNYSQTTGKSSNNKNVTQLKNGWHRKWMESFRKMTSSIKQSIESSNESISLYIPLFKGLFPLYLLSIKIPIFIQLNSVNNSAAL